MRVRSLLRLRLSHWISAMGLLLVYSCTAGMVSNLKTLLFNQFYSPSEHITFTEPTFSKVSLPISEPDITSQVDREDQQARISILLSEQQNPTLIPITAEQKTPGDETLSAKSNQALYTPPLPVVIQPEIPLRLVIPAIDLDAPIIPVETYFEKIGGREYMQWMVPDQFAAGWQQDSAPLGVPGNTVLNGHHNVYGEVFGHLVDLNVGDEITVFGKNKKYRYVITNKMIFSEKYEQINVRINNAEWILPSQDERLTLITCWPYVTNTHRLIIVARPVINSWFTHYTQ